MLLQELKKIKSSDKDLRQFGVTLGVCFAGLAAIFWWKGKLFFWILAAVSGCFLGAALILPRILKPVQKIWMGLALVMGAVMSRVILCLLFYLVVTPIGWAVRLVKKDFLNRSLNLSKKSYWIDRSTPIMDESRYEKQF